MTIEELKALIEKATDNYTRVKAENEKLETKASDLESKLETMTTKFEAFEKQVKAGEALPDDLLKMAETIDDLQNEISDVRSNTKNGSDAFDTKAMKEAQENVVMKAVGAFVKSKDKGTDFFEFTKNHAAEQCKALNISSPETGGLAVAEVLARDVLDYYRVMSPILDYVGRKPSMTRSFRQMVKVAYPNVAEGIENVAGVVPAETGTQEYNEVKSKEFKLYAEPRITNEALYGTDIDVYSDLIVSLGEEIGIYLANQVLYGNGTDKNARGILSSLRVDITDGTGESFKPTLGTGARNPDFYPVYPTGVDGAFGATDKATTDFLLTFMRKLPTRYRANARLYMNENTLGLFEKVRDANERPVFRVTYMEGEPRLNGKPVVIDDTLPDVTSNSTPIIYGDLAAAFAINDGDIDQMLLDQYTIKGCLLVYTEKEMFEMMQRSDAILIAACTTNGPA
ncbi:putative phage major capsid protein [Vibrio phage 142E35-1]|nr:putative phage major capsid protein [Vibrio phage 142E35-1]